MHDFIKKSLTKQCKAIFPNTLNANNTLFGGEAMKWMDEVAYITASRFTRLHMFTMSTDKVKFLRPVKSDHFVEVIGCVEKVTAAKLIIKVEIYSEELYGTNREKAVEGSFVFVSLNENLAPCRIRYPFDLDKFLKEAEEEEDKTTV